MRWIDIDLADPERRRAAAPLLDRAAAGAAAVPSLQERAGVDSPAVTREIVAVGQLLWQAVLAVDPLAFSPARDCAGGLDAQVGVTEADHGYGYHLVVAPSELTLPWNWLHNGLGFLLAHHPLAAGTTGTWAALGAPTRPWMGRHRDALLAELVQGGAPAPRRRAGAGATAARILFLAGHCEAAVRPLLYREAEAIDDALGAAALAPALAALWVPRQAIDPGARARPDGGWQAVHFAGPTSRPPAAAAEEPWSALAQAGWADGDGNPDDADAPLPFEEVGELELVGVDPISALLDQVSVRAAHRAGPAANAVAHAAPPGRPAEPPRWLLEDGPVHPENLGGAGGAPPFVFSNSYLSLPGLGPRFLDAGASTFVGPVAAVLSGPAREFAARFYGCLGDGWSTAAALRGAALACRDRYGEEHPVWLSYALIGHGCLALQYL
ncbi:MAG: hypothetical protein ACYDIE_05455 [Candidatus Krumholzibacteriia bacterium]